MNVFVAHKTTIIEHKNKLLENIAHKKEKCKYFY